VLHRVHERSLVKVVFAAIKAASHRMGLQRPSAVFDSVEGI
jgi:hypothetical protein